MRVLCVSHACAAGVNQQKLEALSKRPGLEMALLVPARWTDPLRDIGLEKREDARYRILPFPLRSVTSHVHYSYYLGPHLPRALRAFRPDIVHVEEEPESLAAVEAAFWARRYGGRFLLFTWENIGVDYRWWRKVMKRYVLRRVEYLLAGNPEAVEVAWRNGYRGPVTVLPQFGVDPQTFSPERDEGLRARLGLRAFTVGFVGRLVLEKGIFVLLQALGRLRDLPWQALVVGDGPSRLAFEEQMGRHGLGERIVLVGTVHHTEVPQYLNSVDVLVLPSLTGRFWKEQFGHVLIEAMACGVPVVGSDSGSIPEVIGDAGLVTREGDAASLAEALARLLDDPALRTSLAARGRARVEAEFTHDRVAERTWAVYDSVMGAAQA